MPWDDLIRSPTLRAALAIVVLLAATSALAFASRRLAKRLRPRGWSVAGRVVPWAVVLAGVVVAVAALDVDLAKLRDLRILRIEERDITLGSLATSIGLVVATWFVSKLVRQFVRARITTSDAQAEANVRAISRLTHYAVMLLGTAVAFQTLGIPIGALLAVGGVFVVALGFAMKELTENFVSGVILLAERAIKPGDILEVDGMVVRVTRMGIRTTMATSRDGEDLIIPNSHLVTSAVKNLTYRDSFFRIHTQVGVAYGTDVPEALSVLRAAAKRCSADRADVPPPEVYVLRFGGNSIDLDVIVWTTDPWRQRRATSELHVAVWEALRQAGITIAFPQMDVHLDVVRGAAPPAN
jgi:potassium efflux system protein